MSWSMDSRYGLAVNQSSYFSELTRDSRDELVEASCRVNGLFEAESLGAIDEVALPLFLRVSAGIMT